jgi:phosphate transport system substrate-binding protein
MLYRGIIFLSVILLAGCGEPFDDSSLRGEVRLDGSSTVFPISEAVAEEYRAVQPGVRVTVGISGTGGGFKKLIAGEIEVNSASRQINEQEFANLKSNDIEVLELLIAYDGLSVVVHPDNDWVDHVTLDELNQIWQAGSQVRTWADVRPDWPSQPIALYAPGAESGTFDYFTERVNGLPQSSRADFSASEDDNLLVQGIAGDPYALGYFGFGYYHENRDIVKLVAVDAGMGPVAPSEDTIRSGQYRPLTRPVFLYVSASALSDAAVEDFVEFYLENAERLSTAVGYFSISEQLREESQRKFQNRSWGDLTPLESDEPIVGRR